MRALTCLQVSIRNPVRCMSHCHTAKRSWSTMMLSLTCLLVEGYESLGTCKSSILLSDNSAARVIMCQCNSVLSVQTLACYTVEAMPMLCKGAQARTLCNCLHALHSAIGLASTIGCLWACHTLWLLLDYMALCSACSHLQSVVVACTPVQHQQLDVCGHAT